MASGSIYGAVVDNDGIAALDQPTLDQAVQQRTETNVQVVTWFTHLGGPVGMTIIAALITVVMVWRWRSRTPLILMVIAVAGSLTLTTVGKNLVGRARPPLDYAVPPYEYAFSFPSGHALNSTVIAGVVAYLLVRRLQTRRAKVLTVVVAAALGHRHGPEPRLPRTPLADRCGGRLADRWRLARRAHHRPPAVPRDAATLSSRTLTEQLASRRPDGPGPVRTTRARPASTPVRSRSAWSGASPRPSRRPRDPRPRSGACR